jgi:hypothetical protein
MATQNSTTVANLTRQVHATINAADKLFEETLAEYKLHKATLLSLPARKQRTKRVVKQLAMVRRVIRILSTAINSEGKQNAT